MPATPTAIPDPSVNQTVTAVVPAAPASAPAAPDVSAVPSTAGALPQAVTNAQNPQPPTPPKETFSEGYNNAVTPQYRVTGTGEIETADPARRSSLGGILGGVLAGALRGMNDAMAAQTPEGARGKGAAFSAGAAAAKKGEEDRDLKARAIAQQNFENNQKAVQDKVDANYKLALTHDLVIKSQHEEEEFPEHLKSLGIDNEEHQLQIQNVLDARRANSAAAINELASHGVYPAVVLTQAPQNGKSIDEQAMPQIPALVSGQAVAIQNGGKGQANGAALFAKPDLDQPVTGEPIWIPVYSPNSIISDGKTKDSHTGQIIPAGQPVPEYRVVQPNGQTTYMDVANGFFASDAALDAIQKKQAAKASQEAALAKTKAETAASQASAGEARARTGLTEAQTQQLQRQAADIAKPDSTGFSSPLSVPEYNKRYGKFTASKQFQNLQQMNQSYQQFQDTLRDINSGKNMTGAQSVVGLFNAIGISAEPLAGKGFRINSNTIEEHIGARGLNQAAYQRLLKLKAGDIITPQQLKDYADIAAQVYENAYVSEAAEAHREGLPADFLPQGGGAKLDGTTARIFTRAVLQAHPELAKDPAKLKQAVGAAAQANGWSF